MPDDDLDERLADPGYTPSVKSVAALVERVARADEARAKVAAAALGRVQGAVAERAARTMTSWPARERRKVIAALVRRAGRGEDDALFQVCDAALADPDAGVQIAAARVLAKLGGERAVEAISAALERTSDPRERTALLASLGKLGGARAAEALAAERSSDPALVKARLIAERTALREAAESSVALDVALPRRCEMALVCRRGLEDIARAELAERCAFARDAAVADGRVSFVHDPAPADALRTVRTALAFGFVFRMRRAPGEDDATCVARAIAAPDLADLLRRHTRGPVRYRLAWAEGGKRRGMTWKIAALVREAAPDLVNDPTQSAWEIVAHLDGHRAELEVFPKLDDTRFAYRAGDVPAASHPTIAAALARVAGVDAADVVWDPFTGSGLELCERALLGPYRKLIGTDVDPRALRVADVNLRNAGARDFLLRQQDAVDARVADLTAVITNPPMGRRVSPDVDLGRVLSRVIANAATMLRPGGRIVLLSPHPMTTQRAAEHARLEQVLDRRVDMTGFDAVLQRFEK